MKRKALLSLAFLLPLLAAAPCKAMSLFFTDPQIQDIDAELDRMPQPTTTKPDELAIVESILFSNPSQWAVWINGQRFTPSQAETKKIRIAQVFDDAIIVDAYISGITADPSWKKFKLKAGETLNLLTGDVTASEAHP